MSILNRRMFATGDVVNQPLIDVTTEIANLSRSGLAPVQILEKLQSDYARMGVPFPQDLGFATIERIAREVGGPLTIINQNPDLDAISTQANTQTNIVPPVTDGFFTPDKTIPNLPVPDFSEDIEAVSRGDTLKDDLPQTETKPLGPNDIRLSDGTIIDFTQGIKDIEDGKGRGAFIYRIYNSPDIETGANVDEALIKFIKDDEPAFIRFMGEMLGGTVEERRGTALGPEDFGSALIAGGKGLFDFASEGLATILPPVVDIFGGPGAAENVREFFDVEFPEGYAARGGFPPEVIDNIVKAAAGVKDDEIAKDLENIDMFGEKILPTKPEFEVFEDVAGEEDAAVEEEEKKKDTETAAKDTVEGEEDTATGEEDTATGEEDTDAEDRDIPEESRFAKFMSSPDFIRYVRNVGKGLAQTGELASGVTLGAAAAAEEKAAGQKREPVSISDQKSIRSVAVEMNQSIKDYNNALAAEKMAQSVIDLANGNEDLATFGAKLGASVDDILAAANLKDLNDFNDLSDTAKARIALTELTNRNIKEILGESGRTISNIDRDIASRIVGNLDLTKISSVAALKKTLRNNIESIVQKRNQAKRDIMTSVQFFADIGRLDNYIDQEIADIYFAELGGSLPSGVTTSYKPTPGVTFYDATQ